MKPAPMIQCPKCSAENPPENKFCGTCAQPLSAPSQMPTMEALAAEAKKVAETPHVARIISSDSIPAGGFTPGTILADRYRIIGLLGRGGMGEVYRADDLKLGQPVALKFLPPKLADDPVRRERFFAEVRITRQLSHPNICRVYDIAEIEGRHFLSMEFIDGEDLASLLKRIGHLTNEKALDIARQLAAGLAAAHERGVLHRDLKPANIMLDGHGRVRITDFGLAIAVEDESQATEIAGTPAYMAPEQLAGKGATVRSDMYSLGLVLYEIYTGKKAFTATTLAELREQKETHTPRAPSELREGIDPVVERLIRRCMERDPNARPSSVAQLALALPGGDPLAAALAAGETPSPEMVAASGSKEGLRPAIAWTILALIIAGTLGTMWINDRTLLHKRIQFEKPPDALIERSREFLKKAGYSEPIADSSYGFMVNTDMMRYIEATDKTSNRWNQLDASAILFYYRQSPRPLESYYAPNLRYNPPLQYSGEVLALLDTNGRLVSLRSVPPPMDTKKPGAPEPDWKLFFSEAGLDITKCTAKEAQWNPPFYADSRYAWEGSIANRSGILAGTPIRIEAASLRGKAVNFDLVFPWTQPNQTEPARRSTRARMGLGLFLFLALLLIGGSLFFALRNLRLGRGDRRSATRLALLVFSMSIAERVLNTHHVQTIWELGQLAFSLCFSLAAAGVFWMFYIAVEPFVRRRIPQVLISWTRLLSGDWRDSMVGRDAIVGCGFGILIFGLSRFISDLLPAWVGSADVAQPKSINLATLTGSNLFIADILDHILYAIFFNALLIFLLFILRIALKNQKAAIVVLVLIMSFVEGAVGTNWEFAGALITYPIWFYMLMRFGLLAGVLGHSIGLLLLFLPIGLKASAWYSGTGYAGLAIMAVVVLYAFRTSLGGRPLIATSRLDE